VIENKLKIHFEGDLICMNNLQMWLESHKVILFIALGEVRAREACCVF